MEVCSLIYLQCLSALAKNGLVISISTFNPLSYYMSFLTYFYKIKLMSNLLIINMNSLDKIQKLKTADDVAELFGYSYKEFAKIFYETSPEFRYFKYSIKKKSGKDRTISRPNKKIKEIQKQLASLLNDVFWSQTPVHGFCKGRSIVTNAKQHLEKTNIFNIDLENFFDTIHFGRIKYLFKSSPFNLPTVPATILANVCCFENKLPQGAPTSPILSNMICYNLDKELKHLAKSGRAIYTRYADDITFSFNCKISNVQNKIVETSPALKCSAGLVEIINRNGFSINQAKVRLYSRNQRLQVTGLKVNEFPNVSRRFINNIRSMLYAWDHHSYRNAEKEYYNRYLTEKHKKAKIQPKLRNVIRGKLNYLKMVRSERDNIYIKYAKWFNRLIADFGEKELPYKEVIPEDKKIVDSVFIIEICYDDDDGKLICEQGTAFYLRDYGIITCEHVVKNGKTNIELFRHNKISSRVKCKVISKDQNRDLAILEPTDSSFLDESTPLDYDLSEVKTRQEIKMFGYPAYSVGQTINIVDAKITAIIPQNDIAKFEIDHQIRSGNSGGPIINENNKVIGVASKGAEQSFGKNAVICINELPKLLKSQGREIN